MNHPFDLGEIKKLYRPAHDSSGEDNGQITVIGGSSLFHGAPLLSLKAASRVVDMVYFASPEPSVGKVAEYLKSDLSSFIWVPWEEVEEYVEKSDAVLIGPGFLRYHSENVPQGKRFSTCDEVCTRTKEITQKLLTKFPHKKWVIDAGSLQTMDPAWIPQQAIITPNTKEYKLLFGSMPIEKAAEEYHCIIVRKGPTTLVCSEDECIEVTNGNPGLTKGGTGDVLAGLTVALLAKNDPMLAASVASYVTKAAADALFTEVGTYFNADDLAQQIPFVLNLLMNGNKFNQRTGDKTSNPLSRLSEQKH